jgi:phosphoglycolate phosphatase-like HAD superfamily hydrolase
VAAGRLGARSLAVRTGGFSRSELLDAGATEVYDSLPDLTEALVR